MLTLLQACSSTPPAPLTPSEQLWQQHRAAIDAHPDWQFSGRIGVKSGADGYHGSVYWRQQPRHFSLRFSGPLAQGGLRLEGDGAKVTLRDGQGGELQAASADQLLLDATGVQVPVVGLRYWVRGLPQPGSPAQRTLDAQGRLQTLEQSGWRIRYPAYSEVGELSLPRKVFLERADLSVRLVIANWQS